MKLHVQQLVLEPALGAEWQAVIHWTGEDRVYIAQEQ